MSDADDDLVVDFTDQEAYGTGFKPVPRNWYRCLVTDWEYAEVSKPDGKFPQGTPGTRWELTIDDGEYDGRHLWITHWHHPKSVPFLKGFLQSTGEFDEDELSGKLDMNDARERVLNKSVMAKVVIRPAEGQYDESNEIKQFMPVGSTTDSGGASGSSLLP